MILRDSNPTPHIRAECAACGHIFDFLRHGKCPLCNYQRVAWATNTPEANLAPYPHVLNDDGTACHEECSACEWVALRDAEVIEGKAGLEFLEGLATLVDPRKETHGK